MKKFLICICIWMCTHSFLYAMPPEPLSSASAEASLVMPQWVHPSKLDSALKDQETLFSCIPVDVHKIIRNIVAMNHTYELELCAFKSDTRAVLDKFFASKSRNHMIRDHVISFLKGNPRRKILVDILQGNTADIQSYKEQVSHIFNGYQPIHFAAHRGDIKVVSKLLKHGANIGASACTASKTIPGSSPLYCAARQGHTDLVNYLLDQDVDCTDEFNLTYSVAYHCKDVPLIRRLVDSGAGYQECGAANPLFQALKLRCYDVIPFLVEAGLNLNGCSRSDHSSLIAAVVRKETASRPVIRLRSSDDIHLPTLKYLLQSGARLKKHEKSSLLPVVFDECNKDVREALLMYYPSRIVKLLREGIQGKRSIEFPHYFDLEIDVDRPNKFGCTALMYAASMNKPDVVQSLLSKGADPSLKNNDGKTAYDLVPFTRKYQKIRLLLSQAQKNTSSNKRSAEGENPDAKRSRRKSFEEEYDYESEDYDQEGNYFDDESGQGYDESDEDWSDESDMDDSSGDMNVD